MLLATKPSWLIRCRLILRDNHSVQIPMQSLRGSVSRRCRTAVTMPYLRGCAAIRGKSRPRVDNAGKTGDRSFQLLSQNSAGSLRHLDDAAIRDRTAGFSPHHASRQRIVGLHQLFGRCNDRNHQIVRWDQSGCRFPSAFLQRDGDVGSRVRLSCFGPQGGQTMGRRARCLY
jgi:hypothetical protein